MLLVLPETDTKIARKIVHDSFSLLEGSACLDAKLHLLYKNYAGDY